MKKLLLVCVLMLGVIFVGTSKLGAAKMDNNITEVKAQHILVLSEAEAINLKKQIETGEITFEKAAEANSQCPSGRQGGDLGFFPRGVMVKEFENAAFDLDLNTVSAPVKTQFGWHLIKVTDKK